MQCPQCRFENPQGMRFCGQCGTPLPLLCSVCGTVNPPGFNFCGVCGSALGAGAPGPVAPGAGFAPAGGGGGAAEPLAALGAGGQVAERRQITVMFCDLIGSTALASASDPEEFRELLQAYQLASAGAIERFEGYIAQYLGDGILAYFGYPVAYDHEAGRAVRAALDIVERIAALNRTRVGNGQAELAVRIGVHSGVVVVSEVGGGARREQLALGEVPNIAARLQSLAPHNGIIISSTTYRMVSRDCEAEDLGPHTVKGLPQQERIYRVLRERAALETPADDFQSMAREVVGRSRELELLLDRWVQAQRGAGQVVVINGDPGIGKSRLVEGFVTRILDDAHLRLEGRCQPYYQNTAFHPIIDLLQRLINCGPEQTPRERLQALLETLARGGMSQPDSLPVFSSLLSLPGEAAPRGGGSARQHSERTRTALFELLEKTSRHQPVVMILEDVHWADPSTLEFLDALIQRVAGLRALLLLTHRHEFRLPWGPLPHLSVFTLHRLDRTEVEMIVASVTGGRQLPPAVLEQIVDRTDGVPLFVEELTRMVVESGLLLEAEDHYELAGPLPPLAIPATLQDSLEARLDRLATTKELAQLGATIGREFGYTLLHAVSGFDETRLRRALAQLVDADLLQQRGVPPNATYTFRHALIQEAAYQSLLKSLRQQYHQRIARVLLERFPDLAAAEPERLAQHYAAAGLPEQALVHWLQAGSRAVERFANREAIAHLEQARTLLEALPDTPERLQQELALQLALGPALIATRGYTAPEVEETYRRAAALCARNGRHHDVYFQVLSGLFSSHLVHQDFDQAQTYAERLLELAAKTRRSEHLVGAHVALGVTLVERGRMRAGREQLEVALRHYDRERHFPLAYVIGQDFGVVALSYDGYALWALGYPDQAIARSRSALELARGIDHPHTLVFALSLHASAHYFRREPQPVLELTAELLELAEREGFHHWVLHGTALNGWARVETGDTEAGLELLQRIPSFVTPHRGTQPAYYLGILVAALDAVGRPEEALQVLDDSCQLVKQRRSSLWREAEMYRLHGLLLARRPGREAEAEEWLGRALELARAEEARMLELRAAMGLLRLLDGGERAVEVQLRLRTVYDTFTEGLELPDLREARQLLELSPAVQPGGSSQTSPS
jgi:class 3 adenylate cyclase/tetratricopeptide (TPR) repeat protein